MSENTNPIESQIESSEVRGTEQESLNDATFEPQSYLEQIGDYRQSEAVQNDFETVVDNAAATAPGEVPLTAKDSISDGEPEKTAKDPLTGKGGENPTSSSDGESSNNRVMDQTESSGTQADAISGDKPVGREAEGVPPSEIDGNDPIYEMDQNAPGSEKDFSEGGNQPEGKTGQADPQRLGKEKLSKELLTPREGPGMKGPRSGGKKPGSVPKSGGGPPVGNYGSGSKGNTADDILGAAQRQRDVQKLKEDNEAGKSNLDSDKVPYYDSDGNYYYYDTETTFWISVPAGSNVSNTLDGGTPMPYTGGGNWDGEDPDPKEPIGGPNTESGRFSPVVGLGGGSDKSGSTPGDKDGDDDSGKFLMDGTLSGDGGGFVDPGDLDYYTPTNLEASEKMKKDAEGRG
ncbi:MAG: hypothetical protein HN855_04415 [Anaerolineae bacterium]|nr:hypothetical protein [Anaerolineae bacterium]MBT7324380.1 hypothetical protein [Anaerolineae bacterium]